MHVLIRIFFVSGDPQMFVTQETFSPRSDIYRNKYSSESSIVLGQCYKKITFVIFEFL